MYVQIIAEDTKFGMPSAAAKEGEAWRASPGITSSAICHPESFASLRINSAKDLFRRAPRSFAALRMT